MLQKSANRTSNPDSKPDFQLGGIGRNFDGMLFMIGGPARTGKSRVAELLSQQLGILRCIGTDEARDMIGKDVLHSVIEGDLFLPEQVAQLRSDVPREIDVLRSRLNARHAGHFPVELRAVFLIFAEADLETIIYHEGRLRPWIGAQTAEQQQATQKALLHFSAVCREQCQHYGVPFVDVDRGNYARNLQIALQALTQDIATRPRD